VSAGAGGWSLREATEADVPAMVAGALAAFAEYEGRLDPPSSAHGETAETVREKLKTARGVLACAAGEVLGSVFFEPAEGHIYLFRLAVHPAYRRRGVGRSLIEYVEKQARALGLPRVRLGVRVALTGQRAYYERLGYRQVGEGTHPGYAKPTYLVLEKELPEK
jgi:ribosomal protein S18 acetylase RimI-like enzyme